MSKGGGLWTIFSTKYCPLIGHKLWHVIKYWTLIGGEEKSFNFSLFSDIHIQGKKTFEILTGHKIIRQYRCTVITLFSLADGMEQLNLLSQHNGTFGILTGFETVRNMSVLLGESATHSHLSKPPV